MAAAEFGSLAQANAEIRAAQRQYEVLKGEQRGRLRPIVSIDTLISDLEDLNLKSLDRVPLSFEHRLARLRLILGDAGVHPARLAGLRTRIRIDTLMDELFAVQEWLLSRIAPLIPVDEESEN